MRCWFWDITTVPVLHIPRCTSDSEVALFCVDVILQTEIIMREVLQSKLHNATVTEANLAYIGSITIDEALMERVDLWEGQKVLVVSNTSGSRLETYVIRGERDSGVICMNGAAAHLIKEGEEVIIIGFAFSDTPIRPKCILVDKNNRFSRVL